MKKDKNLKRINQVEGVSITIAIFMLLFVIAVMFKEVLISFFFLGIGVTLLRVRAELKRQEGRK